MTELRLFLSADGQQRNWLKRFREDRPAQFSGQLWDSAISCALLRATLHLINNPHSSVFLISQAHLKQHYGQVGAHNDECEIAHKLLKLRLEKVVPAFERLERIMRNRQATQQRIAEARRKRTQIDDPISQHLIGSECALGHARQQLPVGQGGFHVGGLTPLDVSEQEQWCFAPVETQVADASFIYVYDCGSEPREAVDREIKKLRALRSTSRLDLLFLSHFDRDHICGVSKLLDAQSGFVADTIVMPYVDDVERMIAFGRAAAASETNSVSPFMRQMALDPIAALGQFNPRQIILVEGGGDEGGRETSVEPIDPPAGGEGLKWRLDGARAGIPVLGKRMAAANAAVVAECQFVIGNGPMPGWSLKPYVRSASQQAVADFSLCAELLLGWPRGSFRKRLASPTTRNVIVRSHRAELAQAYKHAFTDKNLTSLCLYSGPAAPDRSGALVITPKMSSHESTKIGWIGTGDADLRDANAIYTFSAHFRAQLPYVSTFVLPHHGSIHNSDPKMLVSDADNWVVAADPIKPTWRHPDPVLRDVARRKGAFWHVKKDPKTSFDEAFLVF